MDMALLQKLLPADGKAGLVTSLMLIVFVNIPANHLMATERRPITVADSIEMTRLGWPRQRGEPFVYSPDGKRFVLVAVKGNLKTDENEYSLLLFSSRTGDFSSARREAILVFSTGSNNPGISDVEWLDASRLIFLGSRENDVRQVFTFDLANRELKQLTHHPSDVMLFKASNDDLLYFARPRNSSIWEGRNVRKGIAVDNEFLADLLAGSKWWGDPVGFANPFEAFIQRDVHAAGGGAVTEIPIQTGCAVRAIPRMVSPLSPGSKYAVAVCTIRDVREYPKYWREYVEVKARTGDSVSVYLLLDLETSTSRLLVDAPATGDLSGSKWISANSLFVPDIYLPLTDGTGEKGMADFRSRKTTKNDAVFDLHRDRRSRTIVSIRTTLSEVSHKAARLHHSTVHVEEDPNSPPRLVVQKGGQVDRRMLLWDPNPQLAKLALGNVEEIHWRDTNGDEYTGGLYFPPGFASGRRYPFIIQTHGWDPKRFRIDGIDSSAGYAAQALAGEGFIVAQVPDTYMTIATLADEGAKGRKCIEGLIDALSSRELIDVSRMGIQAWSRTGLAVRHALAFSRYSFAAAVLVDSMEGSYGQYLAWGNTWSSRFYEALYGGAKPFGKELERWVERSPAFNLDKVDTPVRILAFRHGFSLLNDWEWYVGLKRLNTPVELIWMPEAQHSPIRPSERLVSQQETVEWFIFWLKGESGRSDIRQRNFEAWRKLRDKR